jgi:hypothetical protein
MQEHEVRELFDRLLSAMDPALEYEERHPDYTVEFPQSGERLDRDGLRRLQESFPGERPPRIQLRRVTGGGDVWFGETVIHYPDRTMAHGVSRIEFRDGKMWRDTRYYAEPFEVPAWRADWSKPVLGKEPVAG